MKFNNLPVSKEEIEAEFLAICYSSYTIEDWEEIEGIMQYWEHEMKFLNEEE